MVKKALDDATTANVTIDTSGGAAGLSGTGQVDYESEPPAVKMTATIAQMGDIDITLVDNTFYLKSSALGGDKWVEVPLDDPNSPFGALGDQLDPAAGLEKLVDGVQSATYVGEEDVDGDELDHYTASVDTATLLKDLPAEAQGSSGLPATVEYEMWFDQDGLIRKFSADLGSTVGTTSGTFDDWGTDVDIEAPPASEVTQMPSLGGSTAG
nr:LppX_LprAFG lipoprotein [Nocardioides flavescens]